MHFKKLLLMVLAVTIFMFFNINSASSIAEEGDQKNGSLKIGDSIPVFKFEDVEGKEASNDAYEDWVIVYTFADRESNETLQKVIGPAAKETVKTCPNLRIAYINIADLLIVPNLLKGVVNPILRYLNEKNSKEMKKQYEEEGLELDKSKSTYYLVPDWDGDHMKLFGIDDAKEYKCFITYNYKVKAVLDPKTKNFVNYFTKTMKGISKVVKKR